ncbi:MAP7 domain-containing protein 2-like [Saccostrea echinata]|uniref:MAP7 domain-containing protein 2-like n=1 Tax=Saccostrea echinata TaxID=191078 RepID=UPI002A83B89B|nr:MAP7 domain-containing protein 2-like [Saccostrea echinata]
MNIERKKQIRFKSEDDIRLLREIVASNPMKNKSKWAEIAATLSSPDFILDARRVRERTHLLIDQHKRENRENLKRSGVDEEITEKTTLLDEVLELKEEEERGKKEEKEKKEKSENMGKEIRKRALECLTPKKDDECGAPKRKNSQTFLVDYLKEKTEMEMRTKSEEMEFKKEQLKLEKGKFDLDRQERMQRMEIEKQEKLAFIDLLKKLTKDK